MFNYKLAVLLFVGYFALIYSKEPTYIQLVLGSEDNGHDWNNNTNNNDTNNNSTNNYTIDAFSLHRIRTKGDTPNYQFFPFNKSFTFLAKSSRNSTILKIALALYPTRTEDQPHYKIFLDSNVYSIIKDDVVTDWEFGNTGLTEVFTKFQINIHPINGSEKHQMVLSNPGTNFNATVFVDWSFDLPYIGFGGEYGFSHVLFDLDQIERK